MDPVKHKRRPALTLVEVLVVVAILAVLLGLVLTAVQRIREAANLATCQAHLKDLALAMANYESIYGKLPPYATGRGKDLYGSWYMHLLPYVGHQDLYELLMQNQRVRQPSGIVVVTTAQYHPLVNHVSFPELVCESDPTRHDFNGNSTTNYLANWYALTDGERGIYRPAQRMDSLTNGVSNVILLAEAYSECENLPRLALYSSYYHNFGVTQEGWPSDSSHYAPKDYLMFQEDPTPKDCDKWRTQTAHRMMPVALADSSVRTVSPTISPATWRTAIHGRNGLVLGDDW